MTARNGEPRLAAGASWAVLGASFGLSAATWIALADLAGFTGSLPLPATTVRAHLSWLMPLAVDGYVVVALVLWMSPVPARVAAFARTNTYAAAGVGVAAQAAYHALSAWSATGVPAPTRRPSDRSRPRPRSRRSSRRSRPGTGPRCCSAPGAVCAGARSAASGSSMSTWRPERSPCARTG